MSVDPEEIELMRNVIEYTLGGLAIVATPIICTCLIKDITIGLNQWFGALSYRKKIQSQEELEHIVQLESKKLKVDISEININYDIKPTPETNGQACIHKDDESGKITLYVKKGKFATRPIVRHELYHLYKKDIDNVNNYGFFRSTYVELRASLYSFFDIKL